MSLKCIPVQPNLASNFVAMMLMLTEADFFFGKTGLQNSAAFIHGDIGERSPCQSDTDENFRTFDAVGRSDLVKQFTANANETTN